MNTLWTRFCRITLWSLFVCLILQGCGGVQIENFDQSVWKNDPLGCKGARKTQLEALEKGKDALRSLNPSQVIRVLGRPDRQELYERNQRYYLYFYKEGKQCAGELDLDLEQTPLVRIRFSAIDIVTEVVVQ